MRILDPDNVFEDEFGDPVSSGTLTFYDNGTVTLKNTYSDAALTVVNPNPIRLNAAGRSPVDLHGTGKYTYRVADANGATIPGVGRSDVGPPMASDITYEGGSVDRTVEAKLSDYVTLADYGVVADGVSSDSAAIQAAVNAAAVRGGNLHVPRGSYGLSVPITLPNNVALMADPGAVFLSVSGGTAGIILQDGNYSGRNILPSLSGFSSYGLKLRGTNVANVFVHTIAGCGDAIVIETISATHPDCLDSNIEFQHISGCSRGVVFTADNVANIIQGNEVRGNFISGTPLCVVFDGTGLTSEPNWDSNKVVLQATDPTAASTTGKVLSLSNALTTMSRLTFRVESWCGGLAPTAKFIDGTFNTCDFFLNLANVPVAGQFNISGVGNKVDLNARAGNSTAAVACSLTANNLAGFNSGVPVYANRERYSVTLTNDLTQGSTVTVYLYHMLTDGHSCLFRFDPLEASSFGVTPTLIADRSATNANEIGIAFTNYTGATILSGVTFYFCLTVGV